MTPCLTPCHCPTGGRDPKTQLTSAETSLSCAHGNAAPFTRGLFDQVDAYSLARFPGLAEAQQPTRGSTGALPVFKRHLPVDHDPAVPVGLLYPPPFSRRQILHDLYWPNGELVQVIDH